MKLAVLALVALAGVAALTIPNLAGAITSPSISSSLNGAILPAGDRTITFTMPDTDGTETSYELYRGDPNGGVCDTASRTAASLQSAIAGAAPLPAQPLVDSESIADGVYCYWVEADDSAAPSSAFSAPIKLTYDTTDPVVTIGTTPPASSNETTPTFGFSADETASAECKLDTGSFAACSSPTTLPTLGEGSHTFTVRYTDLAGNEGSNSYTWTVDTTAPVVSFDADPPLVSNDSTPTFAFSGNETGSLIECKTDGGSFATCSSPITLSALSDASHTFTVRWTDAAENQGTSAYTWTVDTTAPTAAIGTKPGSPSNDATPDFSFSSNETATFECQVDLDAFASCPTTITLPALGGGSHTLSVRATDAAGNITASPPTYTWTIDLTPPTVTIDTKPPLSSNDATPDFSFSSTEAGTYDCQVDSGSIAPCSTPITLPSLGDASHTLSVRAIDTATNVSAPASYTWTVDTTRPTVSIVTTPAAHSSDRAASFTFSSNEPGTFECRLTTGSFAPCTSPSTLSGLADGSYSYEVRAIDTATNVSSPAASYSWTVDATPPPVVPSFTLVGDNPRNSAPSFTFGNVVDAQGHNPVQYTLLRDGSDTGMVATFSSGLWRVPDSTIAADGSDDGSYSYSVRSTDSYLNSNVTSAISVRIDAGPPSVPASVRVTTTLTRTAPVISWNPSTGEPATYRVYRNGVSIGSVSAPATTFGDATLPLDGTADGVYSYSVRAVDGANNESASSLAAQVQLDTTRPPPPASLTAAQSPTAAKPVLGWLASASPDVAGYNVYRGGARINGALVKTAGFTDANLAGDGTFVYTVRSVDNAGNESADSTATGVVFDSTAPGTPGASALAAASGGTSTVSWSASSDSGSGVVAYQVRRSATGGAAPISLAEGTAVCGVLPAVALICGDAGLVPGASYRYAVFAIDAVGNVSMAGQTAAISIPSTEDRTPPKAPTALRARVSNGKITLRWKNPKADLATVDVVLNAKRAPRSAHDGSTVYRGSGTKVSVKLPKLSAGKLVRFAVFALDRSGNASVAARATVIMPKPSAVSLAPNGKLAGDPKLTWNAVTGATYYNVQVFEGTQASKRVGIAWPAVTKWTLPGKYMKKGKVYTWYVWPGIGRKSSAKYGKLIGKVSFRYTG